MQSNIHNAEFVLFLYPQGAKIFLGEVDQFLLYLSHGNNAIHTRSTFLHFYFLGDFLGDVFQFDYDPSSTGVGLSWGEANYRNETAMITFSSKIPSLYSAKYATYLHRYPTTKENSIGARIDLPSDEFAKRDGMIIMFEAVKSNSFQYIALTTNSAGPRVGFNMFFLLCYGERTCQNFVMLRVILATYGTFIGMCLGTNSCANSGMAIDMVGNGHTSVICYGYGACQGLMINSFRDNFADTTQLSGQSLAAKCSGAGNVCHGLRVVSLTLLPLFVCSL